MGIQVERVQFEKDLPPNDLILLRILEKTNLKVKLSIEYLMTEKDAEEMNKKIRWKGFTNNEILSYALEHPKYGQISYYYGEENGKKHIEFDTATGLFLKKRTLMDIFREALISLGGEEVDR